jgi:hypothetical protein
VGHIIKNAQLLYVTLSIHMVMSQEVECRKARGNSEQLEMGEGKPPAT